MIVSVVVWENGGTDDMGFPIHSNIFGDHTPEQAYFARFPIQVAVLFSPSDEGFSRAFREVFIDFDRLTGKDVIFFAVLDPPQAWIEAARDRKPWQEYRNRIGDFGYSMDDRVLVREIARQFDISWGSLPAIVVGTNLWTGEFVSVPTSADTIGRQLELLAALARDWGRPNIGHIADALGELQGSEAEYHPPSVGLMPRLRKMYAILNTAPTPNTFDVQSFRQLVEPELRAVRQELKLARQRGAEAGADEESGEPDSPGTSYLVEQLIEEAAGRLIAPATVADRVLGRLQAYDNIHIPDWLEEESRTMIDAALRTGRFLERDSGGRLAEICPSNERRQRVGRGPSQRPAAVDFTPGAQGVWKALELETNFSVIQAARAARGVMMPELFTMYDCHLPRDRGKVKTSKPGQKPIFKDINQLDREDRHHKKHRLFPLGDAWYVTKAMHGIPTEDFDLVVGKCLGRSLPEGLLNAWEVVYTIRNKGSHTKPISKAEYTIVLEKALSPEYILTLLKIKEKLSGRLFEGLAYYSGQIVL